MEHADLEERLRIVEKQCFENNLRIVSEIGSSTTEGNINRRIREMKENFNSTELRIYGKINEVLEAVKCMKTDFGVDDKELEVMVRQHHDSLSFLRGAIMVIGILMTCILIPVAVAWLRKVLNV